MTQFVVRFPIRIKITLPYALLALLLLAGASYLVTRLIFDTVEERFTSQLIETGKLTADSLARREAAQLETLRLAANLEGMAEAVAAQDAGRARNLVLPVAVNAGVEAVEILDVRGLGLVSLRHAPDQPPESYAFSRGDTSFQEWPFVQKVLRQESDAIGDKYAGVVEAPWGEYFYVSGPIHDGQGRLQGVVLIGASVHTLARRLREDTLAHVTLYRLDGTLLASTLSGPEPDALALSSDQVAGILAHQEQSSLARDLSVTNRDYREILGPLEARGGADVGLVGAALPRSFLVTATPITRIQVSILVALLFMLIVVIGVHVAWRITEPLLAVVRASADVAQGKLDVEVPVVGDDEVTALAQGFNQMVAGLREGRMYRDLLGRTVSPEVREQLRQAFRTGQLQLGGQSVVATVLFADVRDFTALAEGTEPALVMEWLNEYFATVVPIIAHQGGVVNKFDGDAVMASFGVLPQPTPPGESALQACRAALEMVEAIGRLNARHAEHDQPPITAGIGINTGLLVAGGLGSADRLQYTIIGDTVNTAQRIQTITREFAETGVLISHQTLVALHDRRDTFRLEPIGPRTVKGKQEQLVLYRLYPVSQPGHVPD